MPFFSRKFRQKFQQQVSQFWAAVRIVLCILHIMAWIDWYFMAAATKNPLSDESHSK